MSVPSGWCLIPSSCRCPTSGTGTTTESERIKVVTPFRLTRGVVHRAEQLIQRGLGIGLSLLSDLVGLQLSVEDGLSYQQREGGDRFSNRLFAVLAYIERPPSTGRPASEIQGSSLAGGSR